jgi:hypothetical protein
MLWKEHSSMKRHDDAGISKDSSQEIEGLLREGKNLESGRFHLLMPFRPGGPPRLRRSLQLDSPPHPPCSEQDDMHHSSVAATLHFALLSQRPLTESRTSSECVDVVGA